MRDPSTPSAGSPTAPEAPGNGDSSGVRAEVRTAINEAVILVEAQVRASTGAARWNWHDVGTSLRNAAAQLENLPW